MRAISIGDAEIFYEEAGEGPPLMLVPGLGGVGAFWAPQIAALKRRFRCIIHDHRGCGRSTRSRIAYSVEQMSTDALRLMDALKIERAHFVGHSTGGAMGQAIALDHPERLDRLVLSATWAGPDPFFQRCFAVRREVLEKLGPASYQRVTNAFLWPPYWIKANAEKLATMEKAALADPQPLEIALSRIDAIVRFDRRAGLARIKTPTLVICAKDDMVTPAHLSEEIAAAVPGAKLAMLEKGGHFCPASEAEAYNAVLMAFLG